MYNIIIYYIIYIKHIEIKSISSKNVYEKIKVCVYIGIVIKTGEN